MEASRGERYGVLADCVSAWIRGDATADDAELLGARLALAMNQIDSALRAKA